MRKWKIHLERYGRNADFSSLGKARLTEFWLAWTRGLVAMPTKPWSRGRVHKKSAAKNYGRPTLPPHWSGAILYCGFRYWDRGHSLSFGRFSEAETAPTHNLYQSPGSHRGFLINLVARPTISFITCSRHKSGPTRFETWH